MKQKTINGILMLILVASILVASCTPDKPSKKVAYTNELKKFSSEKELKEYLQGAGEDYGNGYYRGATMEMAVDAVEESVAVPTAQKSLAGGGADTASEFSQTNVQVESVDEADIVKNDEKYIYVLAGNKIVIVDAYPAEDAEILSEIEINGNPREFFINGDKLIIFGTDYKRTYEPGPIPMIEGVAVAKSSDTEVEEIAEESTVVDKIPFPPYTSQYAYAKIYDISDREDPEEEGQIILRGSYYKSRMIGDIVYMVTNEYARYRSDMILPCVYTVKGDDITKKCIPAPEIYYFDYPDSYEFSTIMAIDLADNSHSEKAILKGTSQNMYVSENNIYITYQIRMPYYEQQWRVMEEVIFPVLPSDLKEKVEKIESYDISKMSKFNEVQQIIERWMYEMTEKNREELEDELEDKMEDAMIRIQKELEKTTIQRIAIDGMYIEPEASGKVPGRALNQFSMDEHDAYFRIATTTYIYNRRDSTMYNNVYVLDEDLNIVGEIEDIAPEERIYSTRFIGDRLYMVTFKRIDPLFVIDLSDPENPEILGKLKIPGYSDYLHPYDEDHIIGIGKETDSNEWGGTSVEGVKLALFDVSDVKNPKQIDKYEIGKSGTDSEALREHKAFLFDKEKNILVIPVREVKSRYKDEKYGYYRNKVWQGAYVFSITPEDGFEKKGKITHAEDEDDKYYWGSPSAVRRALYMDDVLYTISTIKIKMNDIDDIDNEINEIELPYEETRYDYRGIVEPVEVIEVTG